MLSIDRDSRIPAYVQLMDIILEQINCGNWGENQKLPSERELCETYALSRTTVRQAIQELEKDRKLYVEHGKGTFVSPKRYEQSLLSFYSFTEEMKKLGKTPFTKVISFAQIECDERIARKLNLRVGKPVYCFTRLRYADDELVLMVTSYIPCSRFPGFSEDMLKDNASLYQTFAEKYNVVFSKAQESLQSVGARKEEARLLQITPGYPCMMIERQTFENDRIIEYAHSIARGDKYRYDVLLYK